jgi:hypothetical protein
MRAGPASRLAVARGVAAVVGSAVVVAILLKVTGVEVADSAATGGIEAPPVAARSVAAAPARRAGAERPEVPTAVRLPGGTVVPVRSVDTRLDGVLDVPDDVRTAGWWRGGARVGDPFGSTLLAGHVDSRDQGLGAYAELLQVRPGARVELRSRHLRQDFVVRSVRLVGQGSLADDRWIYSSRGARRLTLVTCAPPYRAERGGYQNLAVVTTAPMSDPERRR